MTLYPRCVRRELDALEKSRVAKRIPVLSDVVTRGRSAGLCVVLGLAALVALTGGVQPTEARRAQAQGSGLTIRVIAGEDAVNVIQQKTAVAPVVEVRDRNGQPVAGAVVRFSVQGGRALFGGARTLSVTTNVAGRAAATGLTPASSGAFQITASAAYQGETAVATIAQTNVMTAAQAAGASGSAASGGAAAGGAAATGATAGGAAAGVGGGVAASTVAVVGAAVGGGTILAVKTLGGDPRPSATPVTYTASFSVPVTFTIIGTPAPPAPGFGCIDNRSMNGTMSVTIDDPAASVVTGTARASFTQTTVSGTCTPGSGFFDLGTAPVTGSPTSLRTTLNRTVTNNAGQTVFDIFVFSGTVAGGAVSGTVDYRGGLNAATQQNAGATTFPVVLR